MFYKLERSDKPNKKYLVTLDTRDKSHKIYFGAKGSQDFTIHRNEKKRAAYIARHQVNEDLSDPTTAGFWAYHLLWTKPTIREAISDMEKQFNLKPY